MISQTIVLPKGRENVERVTRFLASLPADKAFAVEVREHRPTRSDQQNRYLWGVVYKTILIEGGEAMRGWTSDDLHEFFLGHHFGVERLNIGGKDYERPMRRSSRLNKQDFADYIAAIQRFMAEKGVYIPDPNEYLAEAAA